VLSVLSRHPSRRASKKICLDLHKKMGWFGGSSTPTPAQAAGQLRQENEKDKTLTVAVSQQPATPSNLGADVKPSGEKVKVCIVYQ
jgi:hypothetical protein